MLSRAHCARVFFFLDKALTDKVYSTGSTQTQENIRTRHHVQQLNRDPHRVTSGSNHRRLRLGDA